MERADRLMAVLAPWIADDVGAAARAIDRAMSD
jgi:hypothetical protein